MANYKEESEREKREREREIGKEKDRQRRGKERVIRSRPGSRERENPAKPSKRVLEFPWQPVLCSHPFCAPNFYFLIIISPTFAFFFLFKFYLANSLFFHNISTRLSPALVSIFRLQKNCSEPGRRPPGLSREPPSWSRDNILLYFRRILPDSGSGFRLAPEIFGSVRFKSASCSSPDNPHPCMKLREKMETK